jgi:hypothetical protein
MMEGVNLCYIISTFVNVTLYPHCNNNVIIKNKLKVKFKKKDPQSPKCWNYGCGLPCPASKVSFSVSDFLPSEYFILCAL